MKDTKEETALLIPAVDVVANAFGSDDALEAVIAAIEAECRAEHYTVATRDGRERIKSQAYKIARSKTAMDDVGKGLTDEARKLVNTINARRSTVSARLDALKDEVRAPLTKWEKAEDDRKRAIKDRIGSEFGMRALPASSAALKAIRDRAISVELDETFGEFLDEAAKAKDNFLRLLAGKIQDAEMTEARDAELAALRAAEVERRKAEEEAAARAKADEEARQKAHEEARAEIEAERAALAAERAALEAENAARQAEKDAENARLRAELEAMQQRDLPIEEAPPMVEVAPPAIEPTGDNYEVVAAITPVPSIERQISTAVIEILRHCHTYEAMADEIASAIVGGQIPNVQVI